jgi:hypothetical protein
LVPFHLGDLNLIGMINQCLRDAIDQFFHGVGSWVGG